MSLIYLKCLISKHIFPLGHHYSLEADGWVQCIVGAWYGSCWNSYTGCSFGYISAFNISVVYFVINLLSQSPIPMQVVVEKKLKAEQELERHDLGRERFVDAVSSFIYSHLI